MKKRNLLIVSATRMAQKDGQVFVFEPTLREVEKLTEIFASITWIGVNDPQIPNLNGRVDATGKIKFVVLPMLVATGLKNKLRMMFLLPFQFFIILKFMLRFQYVHTRAPSTPAMLAIILGMFLKGKQYWHKFAGNWVHSNLPKSYSFQKKLMEKFFHGKVTINGKWENTPPHILSFENPCFSEDELKYAEIQSKTKQFDGKINLLFVGRMEEEKGVGRILRALQLLPEELQSQINQLFLVGNGRDYDKLKDEANKINKISVNFLGALKREELNKIYALSHIFLLPSDSEGFPKVITEAAAFRNAIIVSNVSSISQYVIHDENGLICDEITPTEISKQLGKYLNDRQLLERHAHQAIHMPLLFTYERYNNRIVTEIFPELGN